MNSETPSGARLIRRCLGPACAVMLAAGTVAARAAGPGPEQVQLLHPPTAPAMPANGAGEVTKAGRVYHVTVPTLALFRPQAAAASNVAVLILPGGGFEHLSIVNEGYIVAQRLALHGITAIVLKYRVSEPPPAAGPPAAGKAAPQHGFEAVNAGLRARRAMEDGDSAMRFIRAHAAQWHIAPDRIGVLGFSAGAVIAMHLAVSLQADTRPDFVACLYGALPPGATVPATAPPLFLAVAADDTLVGPAGSLPIFAAWRAAGRQVELHVFQSGGHGFGMKIQHTTSDHWFQEYLWWLQARGLLQTR